MTVKPFVIGQANRNSWLIGVSRSHGLDEESDLCNNNNTLLGLPPSGPGALFLGPTVDQDRGGALCVDVLL